MSKLESNTRQRIIINCLRKRPFTFKELFNELKVRSEMDERKYTCSERTFQREKHEILSNFGVEIKHNKSTGCYEIISEENDPHTERLMESYDMLNALNLSKTLSKHLILEKRKPLGIEHLHGILHAIKNECQIEFSYEKYWEDTEHKTKRIVNPLALKEAKNRWYVIAFDPADNYNKTFGLDRISNLYILRTKFKYPKGYNPEMAFNDSFGIINGEDLLPQKIVLSLTPEQGKYIKSLPLHHSQKEILSTPQEYQIELFLRVTYDFEMELLSLGNRVKVLEPLSLQNEIKRRLTEAIERY